MKLIYSLISCITALSFMIGCSRSDSSVANNHKQLNTFRNYVRNDKLIEVNRLIKSGYDVNSLGYGKENALFDARSYEMHKLLLENGIDVNNKSNPEVERRTPLHLAAMIGSISPEVVKLLLDYGADPTIEDVHGKTALDYALEYDESGKKIKILQGREGGKGQAVQ